MNRLRRLLTASIAIAAMTAVAPAFADSKGKIYYMVPTLLDEFQTEVMAAALQHLDLDVFWDMWDPPATLIDKRRLKGAPQHGIGRSCKAGKEEIAGLLTALRLFIAEGDAARHARWLADCETVVAALQGLSVTLTGGDDIAAVPCVVIQPDPARLSARDLCLRLQTGDPAIVLDPAGRDQGLVTVNPMCLRPGEARIVGDAIRRALAES